jgi:hypothetical protein
VKRARGGCRIGAGTRGWIGAAALVALAAPFCAACGSQARVPLSDTFDSKEAAVRAVLDGIAARDSDRLLSLAIERHEFRQVVWPELPSSRPEVNLPVDFAWGQLHQNSRSQLAYTLAEHGGRRYSLVAVRFRGASTRHATFTVHRETEVEVRDPSGATRTLGLFGSMLERDGQWKVFSYVVD